MSDNQKSVVNKVLITLLWNEWATKRKFKKFLFFLFSFGQTYFKSDALMALCVITEELLLNLIQNSRIIRPTLINP